MSEVPLKGVGSAGGPRRGLFLMSEVPHVGCRFGGRCARCGPSSSSVSLLSSLELSDSKVCEPSIRALPGTAAHFCKVVVLNYPWMPPLGAIGADGSKDGPR